MNEENEGSPPEESAGRRYSSHLRTFSTPTRGVRGSFRPLTLRCGRGTINSFISRCVELFQQRWNKVIDIVTAEPMCLNQGFEVGQTTKVDCQPDPGIMLPFAETPTVDGQRYHSHFCENRSICGLHVGPSQQLFFAQVKHPRVPMNK